MAASKTLKVLITGDAKGALGSFSDLEAGAGKSAEGMSAKFGKAFNAIGLAAGASAVAAGLALFKIGKDFDAAYDKIRVGTGATGDVLKGLEEDFKSVIQDVPTDFGTAATAITQLNQRLGITGPLLQERAAQFLELSRLTGTDLSANIEDVTRLFGDWSIATASQGPVMDMLFRASQATGVGINALSQQVVAFGAPLRGLGFGLGESIIMLGKWNKEGVNTELVMGAMKKAFGVFVQDVGSEAPKAFRSFMSELAAAPDASTAAGIAIDKLGVKAGPDFAAAVQEGRFNYADLLDVVREGNETIIGAGKDTQDFSEKWLMFKNRVLVALEPLATRVFNAIGEGMDRISAWVTAHQPQIEAFFVSFKEKLQAAWDTARPVFESVVSGLQKIFEWFAKLPESVQIAAVAILAFGVALSLVSANPVITAIAAIVTAGSLLVDNWGSVSKFFTDAWGNMVTGAENAVNSIIDIINKLIRAYNSLPFVPNIGLIGHVGSDGGGPAYDPANDFTLQYNNPNFIGPIPSNIVPTYSPNFVGPLPPSYSPLSNPGPPALADGGIVTKSGWAMVDKGEEYSGVGAGYRPLGSRRGGGLQIPIILQLPNGRELARVVWDEDDERNRRRNIR